MNKVYKDIRANFVFDQGENTNQQLSNEKQFLNDGHIKVEKFSSPSSQFSPITINKDDEKNKSYQKMFEMCQQLNQDKLELIKNVDSLKSQVVELERENIKLKTLLSVYQQEKINAKEEQLQFTREIETLQCQLSIVMTQREGIDQTYHNKNDDYYIYEQLMNFIQKEKLFDILSNLDTTNKKITVQFIVDYLINQYSLRKNQEEKYQSHIKDNIQIIYDLQSKIQDLSALQFRLTTPKSQYADNQLQNKFSNSASNFYKNSNINQSDKDELHQKISQLKLQGKQINKKWQNFCENIISERNELIKEYKAYIESIINKNVDLQQTISEMLKYLGQNTKNYWIQMIDVKEQINQRIQELSQSTNVNKIYIENELKQLYKIQAQIKSNLNQQRPIQNDLM